SFIKRGNPDYILIMGGDHIYTMDYTAMIDFHISHGADVTMSAIPVPIEEASRFGIVEIDSNYRVTSFVEKPARPVSNLVNMGVYVFNLTALDRALWDDHLRQDASHDFGKDILPAMIEGGAKVYAYPYQGYWVDVGTVHSYWRSHMDLLNDPPPIDLYDRTWVLHTRTEERPPAKIMRGAIVEDSMVCDGCVIEPGAQVSRSILSPGVHVSAGSSVDESILLTDTMIGREARIERTIMDKRVCVGDRAVIGDLLSDQLSIPMIGKNAVLPNNIVIQAGASIGVDVAVSDFSSEIIRSGMYIQTRRLPNEVY
ncbi:MAG: glucose-1-phosphate adenylyltransferase, partial [Chloroflexi bacterium]